MDRLAAESPTSRRRDDLTAACAAAAEAVSLRDLAAGMLPRLERAVGASNALLYRYGEGGVLDPVGGSLAAEMSGYTRELLERDPLQAAPRRLAPGLKVVRVTREVDRRAYTRSDAYNLFYRPHDVEHVVCAWLTGDTRYGEPGMTGLLLGRAGGQDPFSDGEVRALEQMLPVLAAVVRRSARVAAADDRRAAVESIAAGAVKQALVALDRAGGVLWMSNAAELALGPTRALPPALVEAARSLGAVTSGARAARLPALAGSFPFPDGRPLRADLSLARTPSGDIVILAELEAPPSAELDALARDHHLTRAEAEVLRILATGRSNREIAGRLHVSVETVRTHVARILAKLGVQTRTQAAVRVRERLG